MKISDIRESFDSGFGVFTKFHPLAGHPDEYPAPTVSGGALVFPESSIGSELPSYLCPYASTEQVYDARESSLTVLVGEPIGTGPFISSAVIEVNLHSVSPFSDEDFKSACIALQLESFFGETQMFVLSRGGGGNGGRSWTIPAEQIPEWSQGAWLRIRESGGKFLFDAADRELTRSIHLGSVAYGAFLDPSAVYVSLGISTWGPEGNISGSVLEVNTNATWPPEDVAKVYTGSDWETSKIWNGSRFVPGVDAKIWSGTRWVPLGRPPLSPVSTFTAIKSNGDDAGSPLIEGTYQQPHVYPSPLRAIFTSTAEPAFEITSYAWEVQFDSGMQHTILSGDLNGPGPIEIEFFGTVTSRMVRLAVESPAGSASRQFRVSTEQPTPLRVSTEQPTPPDAGAITFISNNGYYDDKDHEFGCTATGEITSYAWTFQNGTPATSASGPNSGIVRWDGKPGTHTVTLTVTGPGGSDSTSIQHRVSDGSARP